MRAYLFPTCVTRIVYPRPPWRVRFLGHAGNVRPRSNRWRPLLACRLGKNDVSKEHVQCARPTKHFHILINKKIGHVLGHTQFHSNMRLHDSGHTSSQRCAHTFSDVGHKDSLPSAALTCPFWGHPVNVRPRSNRCRPLLACRLGNNDFSKEHVLQSGCVRCCIVHITLDRKQLRLANKYGSCRASAREATTL